MNHLERNYQLVKERMIEQMEKSIALGRKLIDTELDTGLLNFLIKPIVKTFYDYWSNHEAKVGTLRQIKITLDAGKKLLLNGKSDENFNRILEENFPKYLENDQTFIQCTKNHKNYSELKENAKKTFKSYLKRVVKFLEVNEDINDYGDLCRKAFISKEKAEELLMKQLDFTDKGIQIVEKDASILKVPVGKKIILKALRKGFEQTKEEFINGLNETYD